MSDLDVQIRALIEGASTPVTFEEIVSRSTREPRRSNVVRVLAVATAVVVMLAIGALAVGQLATDRQPSGTVRDGYIVVPSASMEPTLHLHERVAVDPRAYAKHAPARGDVVVLRITVKQGTGAQSTAEVVKRVVGLPGETIEGRDGHIYIDDRELDESGYLPTNVDSKSFEPVVDPDGSYFVLGDNRASSNDSTVFGPVASRRDILGRVNSASHRVPAPKPAYVNPLDPGGHGGFAAFQGLTAMPPTLTRLFPHTYAGLTVDGNTYTIHAVGDPAALHRYVDANLTAIAAGAPIPTIVYAPTTYSKHYLNGIVDRVDADIPRLLRRNHGLIISGAGVDEFTNRVDISIASTTPVTAQQLARRYHAPASAIEVHHRGFALQQ